MASKTRTSSKDVIRANNGFDTPYHPGLAEDYAFLSGAAYVLRVGDFGAGPASPGLDESVQNSPRLAVSGADRAGALELQSAGLNTAPTAKPDSVKVGENEDVLADVLANDYDDDAGAVLTVIAASAPEGQGKASIYKNLVEFDPGGDFDGLAAGESLDVPIDYEIADEHGATARSTVTVTVIGANDGPVANSDAGRTRDNEKIFVDVLANDSDVDNKAVLTVVAASGPWGQGKVSIVENKVLFDPGSDFDHLAAGETAVVKLDYTIEDEFGAQSSATVTITVQAGDRDSLRVGTDEGESLIGTPEADTIDALGGGDMVFGLAGDDLILGGDGNDFASGDSGNDVVDGGSHDDALSGGEGDDRLFGQEDNDHLSGENGKDELSGGKGDDSLVGGGGDDTLLGDDGDDFLSDFGGSNSLSGGTGHDHITAGSADGAQRIDGGDGDDTIRHHYRYDSSAIATGSGRDSIELLDANLGKAAIVVTDFTTGAEGDIFRLSGGEGSLLSLLSGWDGSSNPFGSGFLRLEKGEAGALLQWDRDGEGRDWDWETLVVFEKADAGAFTAANFAGYDPRGSAPAGKKIAGTKEDDTLTGTIGADLIEALDGHDLVDGGAGADRISGDDGSDRLSGGTDNDVVEGGNDDDTIWGGDGKDQLFGQSGNDNLEGGNGDDQLSGGDGDDTLTDFSGANSLAGDLGDDHIFAGASDGAQTIDGGDGNDTIRHHYRHHASIITTGGGRDSIELVHANLGAAAIVVTDFTPGAGGDVLRLSGGDGSLLSLLSGWDGNSNPFGSGFLRLRKSGADTLLQWDRDGAGTASGWETLVVFQNSYAGDFTGDNFDGYGPDGAAPKGETIVGTQEDNKLTGTIGDDTIDALSGTDFAFGGSGVDRIDGGDGDDLLSGEADDDVLDGGLGDDVIWGGNGKDQASGQSGHDALFGENGDDTLTGGSGDDSLDGGEGDDSLVGGDGDDFLTGARGSDTLTGGAGADFFNFQSAAHGPDEIADFVSGIDRLRISADDFGGSLRAGGSVSLISGKDPIATNATGQFLYDTDDGRLLWDADGIGSGGAVLVATFANAPSLQASDFLVV